MANAFTITQQFGAKEGFVLKIGARDLKQRELPPHLSVGESFTQVERGWKNHPTIVTSVTMKKLYGSNNAFYVLDKTRDGDKNLYVFIDFVPANDRQRRNNDEVNAVSKIDGFGDAELLVTDNHSDNTVARIGLTGSINVWFRDGSIRQFVNRKGNLAEQQLTIEEMCRLRVEQFKKNLDEAPIRVQHGIQGGALRLLKHPVLTTAARQILVDFFVDQIETLNEGVRAKVRDELDSVDHSSACMFRNGYSNVTYLNTHRKGAPAARKAYVAERGQTHNVDVREPMKGKTNGGGGKQKRR